MATIVTRAGKGVTLTFTEVDSNFTNLNTDKLENITNESIGDLSDVDLTSIANGDTLVWDNANSKFIPGAGGGGGIASVSEDTAPTLGGNLDVNGQSIIDSVNGDIDIGGFKYPNSVGVFRSGSIVGINSSERLQLDTTGTAGGLSNGMPIRFSGSDVTLIGGSLVVGEVYFINFEFGLGFAMISLFRNAPLGQPGSVMVTGYNTSYTITDMQYEILQVVTPVNGQTLIWNGTKFIVGSTSLSSDTAPALGGNLNVSTFSIVSTSNANINITPNGTGGTVVKNLEYQEFVHSLGTTSGTIAPDAANGNVQTITLNGNLTINAFTNPVSGQTITLIITTGGTGRTLTSSMLFAGASKTLSTTSTVDILTMSYIGTTYYASLVKGYA